MKKYILSLIAAVMCSLSISAQDLHTLDKELPCINKTFSVYFHVTLDSLRTTSWDTEAMEAEIAATNQYFAPICAQFEICKIDTLENWSWDSLSRDYRVDEINRLFYQENRINIYLVDRFDDPNLCGFANLGQIANENNAKIYIKGGCLPHEMGHLFGLLHTFEGSGVENVDGSNCDLVGDLICDTPADPYIEDSQIQWLGDNSNLYLLVQISMENFINLMWVILCLIMVVIVGLQEVNI